MSWLGAGIGAGIGMAIGGPIGAGIGAWIGSAFGNDEEELVVVCPHCNEKVKIESEGQWICHHCSNLFSYGDSADSRQVVLFVTLFSMLGKMAKSDGVVCKEEIETVRKNYLETMNSYDQLLLSKKEYDNGNFVKSADILLNKCDNNNLNSIGKEMYNNLSLHVFDKAARDLYKQGYKSYMQKSYYDAIQKFSDSLNFSKHNYLSDDCYYLKAYSYLNIGDKVNARKDFEEILNNYKDSSYTKDVQKILKILDN